MEIDEAQAKPTNIQNIDKSNARMLITRDRTSKPFLKLSTFLTRQIIQSIIDMLEQNKDAKYLIILTLTREMNHYYLELLKKLITYTNIILILSFDDIIKDLNIDKYILKEF